MHVPRYIRITLFVPSPPFRRQTDRRIDSPTSEKPFRLYYNKSLASSSRLSGRVHHRSKRERRQEGTGSSIHMGTWTVSGEGATPFPPRWMMISGKAMDRHSSPRRGPVAIARRQNSISEFHRSRLSAYASARDSCRDPWAGGRNPVRMVPVDSYDVAC